MDGDSTSTPDAEKSLMEEHTLRVFENRVLRRIFRLKQEELTGGWRGPHNKELHNLYASSNITRVIKTRWMRKHTKF
jgi:hypothetical protein